MKATSPHLVTLFVLLFAAGCQGDAPAVGQCSTDEGCAPGEKCEAGACVPLCSFASDCSAGEECINGGCILPANADDDDDNNGNGNNNDDCDPTTTTCTDAPDPQAECRLAADCTTPPSPCHVTEGAVCDNGTCVYAAKACRPGPPTCNGDNDTLIVASGGSCLPSGDCDFSEQGIACDDCGTTCADPVACGTDNDVCGANRSCVLGHCRVKGGLDALCDASDVDDCADGLVCDSTGRCKRNSGEGCDDNAQCLDVCAVDTCAARGGVDAACDEHADCESALNCDGTKCITATPCAANSECTEPGMSCIEGVCAEKSDTNGVCDLTDGNDDCIADRTCVDSVCLINDDSDAECFGNEECVGTCVGPEGNKLCQAVGEQNAECDVDDDDDCVDGLECYANSCERLCLGGGDDDCSDGQVCIGGLCEEKPGLYGTCDSATDCSDLALLACSLDTNQCLLTDGNSCNDSVPAGDNDVCVNTCVAGSCQEAATEAACDAGDDADCPANHACIPCNGGNCESPNICLKETGSCSADSECVDECVMGQCGQLRSTYGLCEETDDCVSGHTCAPAQEGSRCLLNDDEPCTGDNAHCLDGACVPVGLGMRCDSAQSFGGRCNDDGDCDAGDDLACSRDGFCAYANGQACINENGQCANACIESVCVDPPQTGELCDSANDCATGNYCRPRQHQGTQHCVSQTATASVGLATEVIVAPGSGHFVVECSNETSHTWTVIEQSGDALAEPYPVLCPVGALVRVSCNGNSAAIALTTGAISTLEVGSSGLGAVAHFVLEGDMTSDNTVITCSAAF